MFLFAVRAFTALSFLISSLSFAATEYLPPASTSEQVQAQISKIQSLIPWAAYNNANYITLQANGLAALRAKFPEFDKWAAEKPDPITINIETRVLANQMSLVLNEERFQELKIQVLKRIRSAVIEQKLSTIQQLKNKNFQDIAQIVSGGADSLRGLITGVLQVLPADKKAAIFKAGEPAVQLDLLRELKLTDEMLRNGSFQAERFGLDSKTITVAEVLTLIDSKIHSSLEFLTQLGVWVALKRASDQDLEVLFKSQSKRHDSLLFASDFNFLDNADKSSITNLEAQLIQAFPKQAGKIEKALAQSLTAIPKQWFEKKNTPVEVLKPFAKVVEVHPYLAIHRGCTGGDCSTGSSPMYPYSPWEHVYYIILPDGSFVGYVSATVIRANGKSTLYIKDLTGSKLSPDLGEIVMHAFNEVYPYYKVQQLGIAAAAFTDRENHFPNLIERYAHYNGRLQPKNGRQVVLEPSEFLDGNIRSFIQETRLFMSSAGYDLPQRHSQTALFAPQVDMSGYRVSYTVETLSPFKPKSTRESVMFAMRMLNADETANISEIPGINEMELRAMLQSLKNERRVGLAQYYSDLTTAFGAYGIELSRSFRQEYESFFLIGHTRAQDAFSVQDAALRAESEKYFVAYARRYRDLDELGIMAKAAASYIPNSEKVNALIDLLASRGTNSDIEKLSVFASLGYRAAQEAFKREGMRAKAEAAILNYAFIDRTDDHFPRNVYSPLLYIRYYVINGTGQVYSQIHNAIQQQLAIIGVDLDNIQNPELQLKMMNLFGQMRGFFADPKNLRWIHQSLKKGDTPFTVLYAKILQSFARDKESISSLFLQRAEELRKQPANSMESALEYFIIRQVIPNHFSKAADANVFSPGILLVFQEWRKAKNDLTQLKNTTLHSFFNNFNAPVYIGNLRGGFEILDSVLDPQKAKSLSLSAFKSLVGNIEATLGVNQSDLNLLPEFRQAREFHLATSPEGFVDPSTRKQRFSSLLADITIERGTANEDFKKLLSVKQGLKNSEEMKEFVLQVAKLVNKQQSKMASQILIQLYQEDLVDKTIEFGPRVLQTLIQVPNRNLQLQIAEQLLERNPEAKISTEVLRNIAELLANGDDKMFSDQQLVYSERALEVLFRVRTTDEQIQRELRKTYKEEDNLKMVLKAAIAFVRNGGDPEKVRKYVRDAFKELGDEDKSAQMNALKITYIAVVGKEKQEGFRSCHAVFR